MKREALKGEPLILSRAQQNARSLWDILLLGLMPLALLAIIGSLVVVLLLLIRFLIDPVRFFLVQELGFAVVLMAGMVLAIIVYIWTMRRAFRQITVWRQSGNTTKAGAGLMILALTAILILTLLVTAVLFFY